jgi:uncharacterized membrane protein
MNIFGKLGYYIVLAFNLVGTIILAIPKIPGKLRNINSNEIKERLDNENLKENLTRIRNDINLEEKISHISSAENIQKTIQNTVKNKVTGKDSDSNVVMPVNTFTPEEKENTILILQILSAVFVVVSILNIFNFIAFIVYLTLGLVIIGFIIYLLYTKVILMYKNDFPAYRDFFLMYIAVGILLVLVNSNSNFVMAFSFTPLPSLSVLIFAVVAVVAVFLIYRVRYYQNFTYGTVVEEGKNTAYVRVEYDIRSNVKPDLYIVENNISAVEGEYVKLKLEEKLLSMSGNKPIAIINNANKI